MITYKIHLIRHGKTAEKHDETYLGRSDVPLSAKGKEELLELKNGFTYPKAQIVFTGPLARCVQTAEILYPDTLCVQNSCFDECDFGLFTGKTPEELAELAEYKKWVRSGLEEKVPGGESGLDVISRAVDGISAVFSEMMQKKLSDTAVVTHGGVIMSLLAASGLPKRKMTDWITDFGRGFTLLFTPSMWMRDGAFEIHAELPYAGVDVKFTDDFDILDGFYYENGDAYL